jgi:hypothetical protein
MFRRDSQKNVTCRYFLNGASRSRTGDLLLAKQALSQLSYGPAVGILVGGPGAERCGSGLGACEVFSDYAAPPCQAGPPTQPI